jgi:hypothetical protein
MLALVPKKKRGPGRPPIENGTRKDVVVRLLVSEALRERIEAAASEAHVGMSEWIRGLIEARISPNEKK